MHQLSRLWTSRLFGHVDLDVELPPSPVVLLTATNERGKSTLLGVTSLALRGLSGGRGPVLGRIAGLPEAVQDIRWRAGFTVQHADGRRTEVERSAVGGSDQECVLNGRSMAPGAFQRAIGPVLGDAAIWSLAEVRAMSPLERMRWVDTTLLAEGRPPGPWFMEQLTHLRIQTGTTWSWAFPELTGAVDTRPATVVKVIEGTRAILDEHQLTESLKPQGRRWKGHGDIEVPSDGLAARALLRALRRRVKLMLRLTNQAHDAADGEAQRTATRRRDAPRPPGAEAHYGEEIGRREGTLAQLRKRLDAVERVRHELQVARQGLDDALDVVRRLEESPPRAEMEAAQARQQERLDAVASIGSEVNDLTDQLRALSEEEGRLRSKLDSASTFVANLDQQIAEAEQDQAARKATAHMRQDAAAFLRALRQRVEKGELPKVVLTMPEFEALERTAEPEASGTVMDTRLRSERAQREEERQGVEHRLGMVTRQKAAAQAKLAAAQARREAARRESRVAGEAVSTIQRRVESYHLDLDRARQRVSGIQKRVTELEAADVDAGTVEGEIAIEQEALDEARARHKQLRDLAQLRAAEQRAITDRNLHAQRRRHLDDIITTLSAMLATALDEQLGPVMGPANRICEAVLGRRLTLSTDETGARFLLGGTDLDAVGDEQLRSPRIVAFTALHIAVVSTMDGMRVAFVDDLESVTEERRDAFLSALVAEVRAGTISQVIAAMAADDTITAPEGVHVLRLGGPDA